MIAMIQLIIFFKLTTMTELLQQALKKLSDLPADKQEIIARLILSEIEEDEAKTKGDEAPPPLRDRSLPKSIGMGNSGRTDLSSRTTELLWQED